VVQEHDMDWTSFPTHDADVLVIGGGASGSMAAIEARDQGAEVLLANKGFLGMTGVTASTQGGIAAVIAPPDSQEQFVQDMLKCGRSLNDPALVRLYVGEIANGEVLRLEKYGVTFDRDEAGNLRVLKVGGHSFPRMVMATWLNATTILRYGLVPQVLRKGVRVVDQMLMTRLLVRDHRVCGAVGLNMKSGKVELFRCRAVVLASGNAAQLFGESAAFSTTGDGYSLAYHAGARLRDMEFVSCTIGLAHPPALRGKVLGEPSTRPGTKPLLYNAAGALFMEQHFPGRELYTKDMYMRGISWELRAGRGSPHGGVWYDFSNLDPHGPSYPFVKQVLESMSESIAREGRVEVSLAPYFFPGGLQVSETHESSTQGLFAAGEAAGGLHGAERIASTAMAEAIVFGKRAGRYAALAAQQPQHGELDPAEVVGEAKRLYGLLEQDGPGSPREVRRKLQAAMWQQVGFIRSEANLRAAQSALQRIEALDFPRARIRSKNPKENPEWIEQIENRCLLDVGKMLVAAALLRRESRGSHYREDFPEESAEWERAIVIQKDGAEMRCMPSAAGAAR
jgi:fumarate reductase (CoM/CoB) subunit A